MSRIFVIDDDPGNMLIVKSRLGDLGYEVVAAETGAEGMVEARNESFDLVLITANLGSGIDACELCRRLKAMPEAGKVPILIYSNLPTSPEDMQRGYEAGCDAYVVKQTMGVLDQQVRVLLRSRAAQEDLAEQNSVLEHESNELREHRQQSADRELSMRSTGEHSLAIRELAAGRPDGVLLVDGDGFVRHADRGAREFFGNRLEGRNLGSLTPASGLEAFVRDARSEIREGFRFDLSALGGRAARSLTASVIPLVNVPGTAPLSYKIVLLLDAGRRRIAAEMLRMSEPGIPRQQLGSLLDAAHEVFHLSALVGPSVTMDAARSAVRQFAKTNAPVTILGSKGVGKIRLARTLHYGGPFSGAFLQLRCSAFSPESLERELFGYVEGAFHGALGERPGLFQQAVDGTVYLEEVGDLPLPLQERILEFLKGGTVTRAGSEVKHRTEARLVVSSSRCLATAVREGQFLRELNELLSENVVELLPLVERPEDIIPLAMHFVSRYGPAYGVREITDDALALFTQYDWPANVSELLDCIHEACSHCEDGVITPRCLPQSLRDSNQELIQDDVLIPAARREPPQKVLSHPVGSATSAALASAAAGIKRKHPWDITDEDPISLDHYEMKALIRALDHVEGDKLAAARLLKVGKSTLYRKLKRFGIN